MTNETKAIGRNVGLSAGLEGWEKEACNCLVLAFAELNAIRARDGAPCGVSHEWFSTVVDRIDAAVAERTGQGAWLHPLLYEKTSNLRKAAQGRPCLVRLPGCNGGGEDTCLAHYRLGGYCGTGQKPADMPWGAFACGPCHDRIDRRNTDLEYDFVRLHHAEGCLRTMDLMVKESLVK